MAGIINLANPNDLQTFRESISNGCVQTPQSNSANGGGVTVGDEEVTLGCSGNVTVGVGVDFIVGGGSDVTVGSGDVTIGVSGDFTVGGGCDVTLGGCDVTV